MNRQSLKKLIKESIIEILTETKEHTNIEQFIDNIITISHWFHENPKAQIISAVKHNLDTKIHDKGISDINFIAWVLCSDNGKNEMKELHKLLEVYRGKSQKVNKLLAYLDAESIHEDFYKCLGNYVKNYRKSVSSLLVVDENIRKDTISFINSNYRAKEMVAVHSRRTVMDKDYA